MVAEGSDYVKSQILLPGGRLQLFVKVWERNECHPRVALILKHGYKILLNQPIELSLKPTIRSGYADPQKQKFLLDCVQEMFQKNAIVPVRMSATLGFYSRLFLGPETGEKMEASDRPKCIKSASISSHIQDGDCQSYTELHLQRGVGRICRPYRCLLPHSYPPKVTKSASISCGRTFFPVQSPTFRYSHGSTRIHSNCQGGKAYASQQGYTHPPVLRRLVTASSNSTDWHGAVKTAGHVCTRTRLGNQLQKIRVNSNPKFQFSGVQIRLDQGRGPTHTGKMANFDNCHRKSQQQSNNNSQDPDVVHRHSGISGENSPNGQITHEALPMVSQNSLEVSPIIGQKIACSETLKKPQNVLKGCPLHAEEHNLLLFTDALVKGWGAHLGDLTVSGLWSDTEANLHINILELKAEFLAIRSFQTHLLNQRVLVASDNATVVAYLNKQGGGDSLTGDVSHDLASDGFLQPQGNFAKGSSYPRVSECDNRQSVSQGQDYSDRMVPSSQDFSGNLPNLAQSNGRYVRNQDEQQTTSLCISSPRSKCNGGRCIEYLVAGSRRLCLLPSCSHTQTSSKDENLCLPNDCSSPRVARDELVWGSNRTVHKTPHYYFLIVFSCRFHQNLQHLNLHVWHLDSRPNHFKTSLSQWQRELRHLKDFHQEGSMNRGGPFLSHGANSQVEFEKPTLSSIADFFYLFVQ